MSENYDLEKYKNNMRQTAQPFLEAQDVALQRLREGAAGGYSDDQFKAATDYLKAPAIEASTKRLQGLADQMRAQGVWDSSQRTGGQLEAFRNAEREMASNIDVPLMMQQVQMKEQNTQANIAQAAQLGLQGAEAYNQGAQTDIQQRAQALNEQMAQAEAAGDWQGRATLAAQRLQLEQDVAAGNQTGFFQGVQTLSFKELAQQNEQFEASMTLKRDELAQSLGISKEQMAEAVRQFDLGNINEVNRIANENNIQVQSLLNEVERYNADRELASRQLSVQDRQFEDEMAFRRAESAQNLGIAQDQMDEAVRQFDLGNANEITRIANENNIQVQSLLNEVERYNADRELASRQLSVQDRQFEDEMAFRRAESAQNLGIAQDQMDEAVRQFDLGNANEITRIANENNISVQALQNEVERYDADRVLSRDKIRAEQLDIWLEDGYMHVGDMFSAEDIATLSRIYGVDPNSWTQGEFSTRNSPAGTNVEVTAEGGNAEGGNAEGGNAEGGNAVGGAENPTPDESVAWLNDSDNEITEESTPEHLFNIYNIIENGGTVTVEQLDEWTDGMPDQQRRFVYSLAGHDPPSASSAGPAQYNATTAPAGSNVNSAPIGPSGGPVISTDSGDIEINESAVFYNWHSTEKLNDMISQGIMKIEGNQLVSTTGTRVYGTILAPPPGPQSQDGLALVGTNVTLDTLGLGGGVWSQDIINSGRGAQGVINRIIEEGKMLGVNINQGDAWALWSNSSPSGIPVTDEMVLRT